MHMADALVSPAVGGTMWAVSGGLMALSARRVRQTIRDDLVPMMGVLGAFVFAAQMINFAIPGTGSSGHLGGALLLAILLGPSAAFLVIASVLAVQAFLFADGGLLALGCNIFNLGFFPAFVAYPLIYRPIARGRAGGARAWLAALAAAVVGLQLGALGVVLETTASGIAALPFATFALLMLPVHFAIAVVEGLVTAAIVHFVARSRPEALPSADGEEGRLRPVILGLLLAAVVTGGIASWFASTNPDGLEWSIARLTGRGEIVGDKAGVHEGLAKLQAKTAVLPDYGIKADQAAPDGRGTPPSWHGARGGRSLSGLVGGAATLALALLLGLALRARPLRTARGSG